MPSIKLDHISLAYGSHQVLDEVSLNVGNGERAFLVGPNGCGKTTLLNIASGLLVPDSGRITPRGCWRTDSRTGTLQRYCSGVFCDRVGTVA